MKLIKIWLILIILKLMNTILIIEMKLFLLMKDYIILIKKYHNNLKNLQYLFNKVNLKYKLNQKI